MNKERNWLNITTVIKEELKHLNEQITKQDDIAERKPKPNMNNYVYVYVGSLSLFELAIGSYLL